MKTTEGGRLHSWWYCHALRALDMSFPITCSRGLWFLDCFPLLFFFFLILMLGRHPKPPSESYSDSNCKPVFSGVSQLRSVCFALLWLWVLLSFMWKKASKLVTASSEVTWHDLVPRRHTLYKLICMIRLWFLNFNFSSLSWYFLHLSIYCCCLTFSFCSFETETVHYYCWLSYDWFSQEVLYHPTFTLFMQKNRQ